MHRFSWKLAILGLAALAGCRTGFPRVIQHDTVINPGHGKTSTIGAEKPSLPEWKERGW